MKNSIRGWKEIFSFDLIQTLKSKSIKIATLILCIIAFVSMPVISMINGSDNEDKKDTTIKQVRVADMTGMNLISEINALNSPDLYEENQTHLYEDIEYTEENVDAEKFTEDTELKSIYKFEKTSEYVYMQIVYNEESFDIQIISSKDTKVSSGDVSDYSIFVQNNFKKVIEGMFELDEDTINILESVNVVNGYDISAIQSDGDDVTNSSIVSDNEDSAEKINEENHSKNAYNIMYVMLMFVMLALAFGGERVAMSIITEKSSKVMEYLMTSVKPMAIVVGKILSNLLILLIQLALIMISFACSVVVSGYLNSDGESLMPSFLKKIFNMNNFEGTNPLTVMIAVLLIISGFILYGLIAALAGASVSKIEEMSEGIKMYTIVLVIGAYVGLFALTSGLYEGESALKNVIMLVPFTSLFIAPGSVLTGYLSTAFAVLSLVIMLAVIVLLTKFVANVYESMVYYNGAALKIKDIIKISKQNGKKSRKE